MLLEIVPGQSPGKVSSKVLLVAIERLQEVWMSMQIEGMSESQMPLTDTEVHPTASCLDISHQGCLFCIINMLFT